MNSRNNSSHNPSVAIMTWYSFRNYGTALQAVGLNKAIASLGYNAVDIAYDPVHWRTNRARKPIDFKSRVNNKIRWMTGGMHIETPEREQRFKEFISENLPLTHEICDKVELDDLNDEFAAFVCGSDQVWTPRGFNPNYYLDFVKDESKLIAYAPSFGCDSIDMFESAQHIKQLLRRFSHIGVRETSAVEIIKRSTSNAAPVVLDPTLLISSEEWKSLSCEATFEKPYCLFYFLGDNQGNLKAARAIAKERGLKVCQIPVFARDVHRSECPPYAIGPAEFLWLASHAELVCTDSFHGIVFASIFNRDFVAFERFDPKSPDSQNTRVYSFLTLAGAEDALLRRVDLSDWRCRARRSIDFKGVDERLETKRKESLKFLFDSLSCAVGSKFKED